MLLSNVVRGWSTHGDLDHVDGDQQRLGDELVVTLPAVDPPLGGDDDPVYFAIVGGIVQTRCAAQDVDGVVVAAQQPVRAKARDLLAGMAFDVFGKRHLQPPPRFTADLDRNDLFGDESGPGVDKWCIQICPQRLPAEIGDVNVVPRGVERDRQTTSRGHRASR